MQYTIKIDAIRTTTVGDMKDVIKQADWTITGTQDGQSFSLQNTTELLDPSEPNFIPLSDVAEAEVASWVEETDERMPSIKDHISIVVGQMVQSAALTPTPLPWNPPAPPVEPAA